MNVTSPFKSESEGNDKSGEDQTLLERNVFERFKVTIT